MKSPHGDCKTLTALWQRVLLSLLILFFASTGLAKEEVHKEKPSEAAVDEQEAKPKPKRWLPIPIFITEPAVGYGLGLALGYIHPKEDDEDTDTDTPASLQTPKSVSTSRKTQKPPPTITGVAGGYTESDTWFGAVGHSASWRGDSVRYAGALAYTDIYSTYYIFDSPIDFNLEGAVIYQDLKLRLGDSHFFMGGKLAYLATESDFKLDLDTDTSVGLEDIESNNVGIALAGSYDRRDNVFTPNSGQLFEMALWRYDEAVGSDYNYWNGTVKALSFHPLHETIVLGLRLEASAVDGNPPFYAYPWVTLRGIPALRYQGEAVAMAEVEGRWNVLPRWAVIGFIGTGGVYGDDPSFETQDDIVAGGIGGRYLFMPERGLWLGMDFARGPEAWYWYITIGQAW